MGASTSVSTSTIDNKSIANVIMSSITTNSNSSAATTSTSQNAKVNFDGATNGTFSQTADITQALQSTISTSSDAQLQATSNAALTALAKQNTSASSSVGLNTSVSVSKETQTAISNVSQLITVSNISSCRSTVAAEQNLDLSAKNSTGVNVTQGLTISNMATCLMSNSSINSALTALTTQMKAETAQTTSASLMDTTTLIAVLASCCALCILSSLVYAGYRAFNGESSGFKSIGSSTGGRISGSASYVAPKYGLRARFSPYARNLMGSRGRMLYHVMAPWIAPFGIWRMNDMQNTEWLAFEWNAKKDETGESFETVSKNRCDLVAHGGDRRYAYTECKVPGPTYRMNHSKFDYDNDCFNCMNNLDYNEVHLKWDDPSLIPQ